LLLKYYPIIIYNRLGFEINREKAVDKITILDAPILDISASIIRKNIKTGKSIQYLVTEAVEKEIMDNSYYK
jgi:nicotinate-nucleotide adenylyltransferase